MSDSHSLLPLAQQVGGFLVGMFMLLVPLMVVLL